MFAFLVLPNVKGTTLTSKISLIQIPPTGALSLENIRTATYEEGNQKLKRKALQRMNNKPVDQLACCGSARWER